MSNYDRPLVEQLLPADIKPDWAKAPIPRPERQALFLRYGLDLRQSDIGKRQGVNQKAVSERLPRGVGRIVATLNGTETH